MQGQLKDAAESYVNWWAVSGVDMTFLPETIVYANESSAKVGTQTALADTNDSQVMQQPTPAIPAPVAQKARLALPDNLPDMLRYLAEHDIFSDALTSPDKIIPIGPANAKVMIIADMPDAADIASGSLLAGPSGVLFDAMLKAIGLDRAECFMSSLAFSRIPGGRIDAADANTIIELQRKLIALVRPGLLLLLGDKTSRALTGMDLHEARGWLRDVNHLDGTIEAVTTFHPRFLLQRPQLKRAAWDDLKRLKKGIDDRA